MANLDLPALRALDISFNNLSGPITDIVNSLPNLKTKNLEGNVGFFDMREYEVLIDAARNWGKVVPQEFVDQKVREGKINYDSNGRVRQLDLSSSKLNGIIAEGLWDLTCLEELNIRLNNISGSVSPSVGNLRSLKILNISYLGIFTRRD